MSHADRRGEGTQRIRSRCHSQIKKRSDRTWSQCAVTRRRACNSVHVVEWANREEKNRSYEDVEKLSEREDEGQKLHAIL